MRVAGQIIERLQLPEDGDRDGRAEHALQLTERRDRVALQVLAQDVWVEGERSHNVRVPTQPAFKAEL